MPANVETAVYANTPAWHREGTVLDTDGKKGLTVEVALPESGLNWEVSKVPIFAMNNGQYVEIKGRYGVQRDSDGRVFGTVGKTWQPVQNSAGFQLIDDIIAQAGGEVWIEAAGALDGGKKVWVMAHVDNDLQIAGEKYASFITFINGHDGRTSVTSLMHDERIVCANTMDIALGQAGHSGRIVRVRHTTKAADRIKEAAHILGMRNQRAEELAKQGEWLVEQTMDDGDFAKFLDSLMPITEENEGKPAGTMIQDRRAQVSKLFFDADNLAPIRGTRWAALQATIEFADHRRTFKDDNNQVKAQFGLTAQGVEIKDRANQILSSKKLVLA